jgi:hypothetical protein
MGGKQQKGKEGVNSRKGFEKHYKEKRFHDKSDEREDDFKNENFKLMKQCSWMKFII